MERITLQDLFNYQFTPEGIFTRYDIVVKYMAIEDLYEGKSYGVDLYTKMYIGMVTSKGRKIKARIAFMKSLNEEKLDIDSYPVLLTSNYKIRDGSHRIAGACYFNREDILYNKIKKRGGGIGLKLMERFFSEEEMAAVESKKEEILKKLGIL